MRITAPLSLLALALTGLGLFLWMGGDPPAVDATTGDPPAVDAPTGDLPAVDAPTGDPLTAGGPGPQQEPTEVVVDGDHFTVICWFVSERNQDRLALETLEVVENTWEGAETLYGVSASPLAELRFQINVDADRTSFQGRVNGLQPGAVEKDFGWSHHGSRAAFVRLQPPVSDRVLEKLGIPPRTLRRVAREAARLARLEAGDSFDTAPAWFAAGSEAWLAGRAMRAAGRAAPGFESPYLGARLLAVRAARGEGRDPSLQEFLAGAQGQLDEVEVDCLRELFFTFLMESTGLERWADLGPRLTVGLPVEEQGRSLSTLLGLEDVADLEATFLTWLDGRRPLWREQEPILSEHPDGWIQTPILGRTAICWAFDPPAWEAYTISGEFMMFRDRKGMGQVNVLLGELDGDYLQVSFHSTTGVVVFSYERETGLYTEVTTWDLRPQIPSAAWIQFRVRFADELVSIRVHEQDLRPFDMTGRDMSGAWGVGCYKGSSVIWRNLRIEPD